MRKTLLFLLLLCTKLTFAQLNDNFSDGDFTSNPVWGGNTDRFIVNANGQLQSNGPTTTGTNVIYLSTSNTLSKNVVWEFFFQTDFNPTEDICPRIYLVSNQADFSGNLQGYYFKIGEAGTNDGFHLYRQATTATSATRIITGAAKTWPTTTQTKARIRITRDNDGKWELYSDVTGGTNFVLEGTVTDNTYTTTTAFGVHCRYNVLARSSQFIFDDFKVYNDNIPPSVTGVKSLNSKTLEVTFDEPLNVASAQIAANYSVSNGVSSPLTAVMGSTNSSVVLTYANDFTTGNLLLSVTNVADTKGNAIITPSTKSFIYVGPYTPKYGDVVINEIMADQTPVIGLPEKEWIELFNTTDRYIIITGWKYKDGSTSEATLGADTLAPKEYRILCANADVATFKTYGKTLGISPWPSLNNASDDLLLRDNNGTTIFSVSYSDTWYQDATKKEGGYTLELINPFLSCTGSFNWIASNSTTGGTPGAQNSVYNDSFVDQVAPKLVSATVLGTRSIRVDFNRSIVVSTALNVDNFVINNTIDNPILVSQNQGSESSFILTLAKDMSPNIENLVTVTNVTNCSGTIIDPNANTAVVVVTESIKPQEILISEVLFNPFTGGVDFVEVYNPTNKILDLKELSISNPTASSKTKREVSATSVFIRPKTYWVLTANPDNVKQNYDVKNPSQMVTVASMPAFNNGDGRVALWSEDLSIDSLDYTEKMHHVLLREVKGVSLERVSFTKSGNEPGNLQSAAASVGFATPTNTNSQSEDTSVNNSVTVANKTFSPDNDGFEDLLQIDYRFKENGNLATVNIYTDKGVLVRKLARNITMSTQGTVTWDGLNDGGQLCKVGLYVIITDIFNINGNIDRFKQTCVLASKLN